MCVCVCVCSYINKYNLFGSYNVTCRMSGLNIDRPVLNNEDIGGHANTEEGKLLGLNSVCGGQKRVWELKSQ